MVGVSSSRLPVIPVHHFSPRKPWKYSYGAAAAHTGKAHPPVLERGLGLDALEVLGAHTGR